MKTILENGCLALPKEKKVVLRWKSTRNMIEARLTELAKAGVYYESRIMN